MKRRFISMVLFIAMLLNLSSVAMAAEKPNIVDKEIYKELKDPYEILDLTIKQHKDKLTKRNTSNDEIVVTQLLEKDTYSDGRVEEKYATTSLLVLDKNNKKVGMSQMASASATYTFNDSTSTGGGNYNLVDSITVYWTEYYDGTNLKIKSNYTTNIIVGNTTGNYFVTKLDCVFTCCQDPVSYPDYTDHVYFMSPSTYTTYTAYNPEPRYLYWTYFGYSKAGSSITYSDGSTYDVWVDLFSILQYGNDNK